MNILVTGIGGFTGHKLAKRLLDEGHTVSGIARTQNERVDLIKEAGATVIMGTITDEKVVDEAMQGVDIVMHIAAAFRQTDEPKSFYHEVNYGGTKLLMETALKYGVRRFIHTSTMGVHGDVENIPGNENSPIKPNDYYQESKADTEPMVWEMAAKGLTTVIIRPAAIYGPGDAGRFSMIFKWCKRGFFPMFGDGTTYYQPVYIDNLVDAYVLVAKDGVGDGGTYIIADSEYVEIADLVRRSARAMGIDKVTIPKLPLGPVKALAHVLEAIFRPLHIKPPIHVRRTEWFTMQRAFTIDKARAEIGYEPVVDLDEGLKRTAEWLRDRGDI